MSNGIEFGWLLDNGRLCIGLSCNQLAMVTYTDPNAIRFARKIDAELMLSAFRSLGMKIAADRLTPIEHGWG